MNVRDRFGVFRNRSVIIGNPSLMARPGFALFTNRSASDGTGFGAFSRGLGPALATSLAPAEDAPVSVRFGAFELDDRNRELRREGQAIAIQPKVFDCIELLVRRAGQLITLDELHGALWKDVHVGPDAIRRVIRDARRALGDGGAQQALIRTRKGIGYVFVGKMDAPRRRDFVGRERELATLSGLIAAASGGVARHARVLALRTEYRPQTDANAGGNGGSDLLRRGGLSGDSRRRGHGRGDGGDPRVTVTGGSIEGVIEGRTRVFRGIPYAAPPLGDLRFAPPVPVVPWSGTRTTAAFGPSCLQPLDPVAIPGAHSEDCLTLNVAAPESPPAAGLPVMVFIHGGGFTSGGSADFPLRGLSEAGDVVVVTLNYRLGALGFLSHAAIDAALDVPSGNMGLRDQQFALRWVRDNIAAFGGDSANVTLLGQSAGSVSTCLHVFAKGSEGLASRFILESGSCYTGPYVPWTRDAIVSQGEDLVADLCAGASDTLACLRGLPGQALIDWESSSKKMYESVVAALFGEMPDQVPDTQGWWPYVDGNVLPDAPSALLAQGGVHAAPVILGSTLREFAIDQDYGFPIVQSIAALNFWVDFTEGNNASAMLGHYTPATDAEANEAYVRMSTDQQFRCPMRTLARALSAQGFPTFLYSFEVPAAQHTLDLDYVFGPTGGASLPRLTPPVVPLASVVAPVQAYWTNFARGSDPNGGAGASGGADASGGNGGALPAWPAYATASDEHLVLADPVQAGAHLSTADCDFIDGLGSP